MAKPAVDRVSPPTITARQDHHPLPVSTQRRRRRRPPAKFAAGPSSGVLSLLATISAASSSADGSPVSAQPTPPPFLCPYIARDNSYDQASAPLPDPVAETSASALSPPTPTSKIGRRGTIADKFVQGSDGMYRRVDRYTLYGSTVCSHCEPTIAPNDDAKQPSAIVSSPSSAVESPDEFAANMPNGWKAPTKVNNSRVTLILAISLVLSFVICVFMATFIIWRRKKRRREKDEELKLQKSHNTSEHQELVEKEARLKQKFWTRASARWKANVRSSARRRRNRRVRTPSTVSVHDIASTISVPQSTSSSFSRRQLTVSAPEARSSEPPDRDATQNADDTISVLSSPDLEASSPPAYIYNRPPIQIASKLLNVHEAYHIDNEPLDPFSESTHDDGDDHHPQYTAPRDDDPIPYDDSYHAGHVAIDDKSLLAQMAHLASAPPNADEGGSSVLVISAPDWHDEELERVIDDSLPHGQPNTSSFFPAPPAKDRMPTPNFYEYPYSFEEDADSLALEPSAPPFEQHTPSAPPLEDAEIVPSAPPLPEEPFPSAPDWVWDEDAEGDRQLPSFPTPVPIIGHLPSYRA